MRRLTRGECPSVLIVGAATELIAATTHFEGEGRKDGFKFKAYSHVDVKAALSLISLGKCAYCEADYDVTQPSDLEHFRPKAAIDTDAGRQKPGYWWLGATWSNLLPSCIRCNRSEHLVLFDGTELKTGKANRFPLVDEAKRATAVGAEVDEQPLLIDPSCEDPALHIKFIDDEGRCIAVPVNQDVHSLSARRARASIDIFGLNRAALVRDRSRYMRRAKMALARIGKLSRRLERLPIGADEERQEIYEMIRDDLNLLGELTYGDDRYTGMLRTIVDPALTALGVSL